ncbi:MAG: hypothetical protein RJA49_2765 [Actinomycetota bacterium]
MAAPQYQRRHREAAARMFATQGRTCALRLPGCTGYADTADHVVPVSLGGVSGDEGNLRPACRHCNSAAGNALRRERGGNWRRLLG